MRKLIDRVLIGFAIITIILAFLFIVKDAFSANVTDTTGGKEGFILVNDGSGQGHKGTWTDPSFLKGAKGDKGDMGLQGIQGVQGLKGDTGSDGKDIDPSTVLALQNGIDLVKKDTNILSDMIDNVKSSVSSVISDLTGETNRATSSENNLQSNINTVNNNSVNRDNVYRLILIRKQLQEVMRIILCRII